VRTAIRFVLTCIVTAQLCFAQAPAAAPAGSTGLCNDGTYYTGAKKQGACRGHKGVKEWWGAGAAAPAANAPAASAPAATTPAKSSATSSASAPAATNTQAPSRPATAQPTAPAAKKPGSMSAPAPGGGADQVWVNTASNVYHCPGTRYYGKTKAGAYMTEADAVAKGARPERGKACK